MVSLWKLNINKEFEHFFGLIEDLGKKWVVLILLTIYFYDKISFGMLKKIIKPITSKVLCQKLKFLEQNNLILKRIVLEQPRKFEYCITETGKEIASFFLNFRTITNKNNNS